jgi:polynucleotide 5'-hydroxyl-kinase GRC3/NOL9
MLAKCSAPPGQTPRSVMLCGPKSSGKSTFAKFLVNRLLSTLTDATQTRKLTKTMSVALLDLDPGQPEYAPPGQLSLVHVFEPNFGPPFAHPIPNGKSKVIRSHAIGAISPSLDPSLYMACVADLLAHYRSLLSTEPNCPLVINTPGWVFGTGLEILVELITQVRPSEIIYMSQDGPAEVVTSLREAAKLTPVLTLPSQVSEYTTRTAAHLRTMQTMSYFHLDAARRAGLAWNTLPLTSMPPWEIRYSGENPGLLGVICYGEQPPANLLADTINGSLVAVVAIDDMAAIPGWNSEEDNSKSSMGSIYKTHDTEIRAFDQYSLQPQQLKRPLILPTPDEGIPYFNPSNAISLDPRYSHSIGLALVRGIDMTRRRIQVLTPILSNVIEDINQAGKSIVLISGKLDIPGWAYIEELTQKTALDKAARKQGAGDMGFDEKGHLESEASEDMDGAGNRGLGDRFQNAPWVDKLEGSQGRGLGSRVWRVRRDLGRTGGDGGE